VSADTFLFSLLDLQYLSFKSLELHWNWLCFISFIWYREKKSHRGQHEPQFPSSTKLRD